MNKVKELLNFRPFNRENILKLVCLLSVLFLVLMVIISYISIKTNPNVSLSIMGGKLFSDFAETLSYCIIDNPYRNDFGINSIYPPFAYLIFYPFALICKSPLEGIVNGTISLTEIKFYPSFVISYLLYFIINVLIILLVVKKMSGFKGKELIYLLISVTCFGPLIYCFGRGNVLITALLFALLFFAYYNSEKRWQRELANFFLACAIGIKIYPIILVFFFFKERRFMDFLKTIVYSLLLLFIPFLLTSGGFNNIKEIWYNFTHFNSGEGRDLDFSNISLDSTVSKVVYGLSQLFNSDLSWLHNILSKLTRFSLLLTAIVLPLFKKNSKLTMQFMLLSILAYELFQGVSYGYTMLILLAPIVCFFKEFDSFNKKDKLFYGVCYALLTCQLLYIGKFYLVQAIVLIVLAVKVVVDVINDRKENNLVKE